MLPSFNVTVMVGSLRQKSFNRMLANEIARMAAPQLNLTIAEISDLPFYNEDLENGGAEPVAWQRLREKVASADAVLFVSPEYNRSIPAALKNAIDVLSRPYGKSAVSGKPAAVITASPGGIGGFGASHHLRQTLVGVGAKTLPSPEVYIAGVHTSFEENGQLNERTATFINTFINSFHDWINQLNK